MNPPPAVITGLLAVATVLGAGSVHTQAPTWTLTDFPRYPGEVQPRVKRGIECDPASCRWYVVGHPIEEVYPFYRQRLVPLASNVTRVSTNQDALATARTLTAADNRYLDARDGLKPGQATPVFEKLFTSTYAEAQEQYKKGRAPSVAGEWLARVEFKWAYQRPSGELTEAALELDDALEYGAAGAHQTEITFKAPGQAAEAAGPAELGEPSAGALGVPVYPGARFNAGNSSADEYGREYAYESGDPPSKVVQFYETKLGKRALTLPDNTTLTAGAWAIVLQGTPEDPKDAVVIMPGGTGKTLKGTVIVFRKPPK